MGWLMQVLSVRGGRRSSLRVHRAPFRLEAETDVTDTAFKRRSMYFSALPPARALIEGSARDPQLPTAIAPTGTNLAAARSLLAAREVPRPTAASARRSEYDSAAAVVGSDRTLALNVEMASAKVKVIWVCVAHCGSFTSSIATVSNLVPCRFGWPFRHPGRTPRHQNALGELHMTQTRPEFKKRYVGSFVGASARVWLWCN